MISRKEILKGREVQYPLTEEFEKNIVDLLEKINKVRDKYGKPMGISSGYRPGAFNVAAGGAKKSSHQSCQAVDIADADGSFKKWALENFEFIKECGLYMEAPESTPTWCHLQTRPTKNNPFKP